MCGIAGFAPPGPRGDAENLVTAMARRLAHRGPDDERVFVSPDVALGFRRLSVIDLESGAQPMTSPDGRYTIVLNGEIYNYRELRDELASRGATFRTRSDTESVLVLFAEMGGRCVERLDGMFAFAVWDAAERSLFLARDRVGKKPLVYALLPDGGLAFASEMKALVLHPGVDRSLDPEALNQYLAYQCVPGPRTIYRGVRRLLPAHTLTWKMGREPVIARYWRLDFTRKRRRTNPAELAGECREQLRAAVRRRLVADVPLGALLSSGIDSSAVVALMSEAGGTVRTFSMGFDEAGYSELPAARELAAHFGTEHREFVIRPDAASLLPRLAAAWDEPYADCSALPTFCLAEAARRHVTVALSGDGGDEAFAGYPRYRWLKPSLRGGAVLRRIPRGLSSGLARTLPSRPRLFRGAQRLLRDGHRGFALWNETWYCLFGLEERRRLFTPEFLERLPSLDVTGVNAQAFENAPAADPVEKALWMDMSRNLPDDLLVKMDIASMAHGLEVRSPFLDHHLLEWAATIPPEAKRQGGDGKRIVKAALKGLLPESVLSRPKRGFSLPVDAWFKGPLRSLLADTVMSPRAVGRGTFRRQELERIIAEHEQGRRAHGQRLWALLMLELWHRGVAES